MTDAPIKIPRYIELIVKEPLDKAQVSLWMIAVRQNAPNGVVATIQTTDAQGGLRGVAMVHKEGKRKHSYLIPLTRDLLADEVQTIVDAFIEKSDLENFDISTNQTEIEVSERNSISINDKRYMDICNAIAKAKHEKWMTERLAAGWRYGIRVSSNEKTHPLLRPWTELPDQFRTPDLESPQAIIDLIQKEGYIIIARDELERLMNKAKNN